MHKAAEFGCLDATCQHSTSKFDTYIGDGTAWLQGDSVLAPGDDRRGDWEG